MLLACQLTLGEDGATHQILEDIGLMKMLPHMTVVVPADYNQTAWQVQSNYQVMAQHTLRFGRLAVYAFLPERNFPIGKAQFLSQGTDVTIIACVHGLADGISRTRIRKTWNFSGVDKYAHH